MENKKNTHTEQIKDLKSTNKKDTKGYSCISSFRDNYENDIHTDPLGSWTGVPLDDPYDKPIQDADDL